MALVHFLYRCPRCGHDPTEGRQDEARCPKCGTRFRRSPEGLGRITVLESSGERREVPAVELADAIEDRGGPLTRARDPEGRLLYRARTESRTTHREKPVWHKGELLGSAEVRGPTRPGILAIDEDALELFPPGSAGGEGGSAPGDGDEARRGPADLQDLGSSGREPWQRWPLLEIRAVQTSSSSLQISPAEGGVVEFRFPGDSTRRWESLLHHALRQAFRRAGRGEIVEFQPRIRVS